MLNKQVFGWDIGGAHVKLAVLDNSGNILAVRQYACPLWKGIGYLQEVLDRVKHEFGSHSLRHCLTMTGELADCFADREEGVLTIVSTMQSGFSGQSLLIFAGRLGFVPADQLVAAHIMHIASANWVASAVWAAKYHAHGLFVDIGSTTCDILLLENQQLNALGYSDYDRLVSGELLYTGIIRSAVPSIAQRAVFRGREMGLMAEFFATMADVYRLTGDLQESHDQAETADGAEKTRFASARRLSRLTGYEFAEADWEIWLAFAQHLKHQQKQLIWQACLQQLQRCAHPKPNCLIGAGVGRFLLVELAQEHGWTYLDFKDSFPPVADGAGMDAGDCAPAVAVAYLALDL